MKEARRRLVLLSITAVILSLTLKVAADPIGYKPTPLKGRGKAQIVGVTPGPSGVLITAIGTGNSTHLGRFTRTEYILLDTETGAFTGSIVFTSANGDELWCNLTGGFTGAATAEGTYEVTGGTGRFTGATGNANFGVIQSDPVNFTFDFDGRIELN